MRIIVGLSIFLAMGVVAVRMLLQSRSILTQVGGEPARIAEFATRVANGDFTAEPHTGEQDATGILAAVQTMTGRIETILKKTNGLIQTIQREQLDVRGNSDNFSGGWRAVLRVFASLR